MYILDCTLRDGGYYNDWDFDAEVVQNYLAAVAHSGIKYVELGLRNFPQNKFLGAFAYTTESFLRTLNLPSGPDYGVMVDSKTILTSGLIIQDAIDKLFVNQKDSCIKLVRIASHFFEVEQSKEIAIALKDKGYTVGFNLMQAAGKSETEIASKVREIKNWDAVNVIYFADSLGNMNEDEVVRIAKIIKNEWPGHIGIHTHDNMGRGLANSLVALREGVTWIDATITGMGRGAGNTQTENLLAVLQNENKELEPSAIYELVIRDFEPMQRKYGWGTNLLYFLGAQHDVHPTYIQNLLSNTHIGKEEIVGALHFLLKQNGTNKYDGSLLEAALNLSSQSSQVSGQDVSNIFANRQVLLVTNSETVGRYQTAIELYIEKHRPLVITLNLNSFLNDDLVDYVAISHNFKFLSEKDKYKFSKNNFILPKHRFADSELKSFADSKTIDYGVKVTSKSFEANSEFCCIPSDLTIAYVLAFCIATGVSDVKLVGFDGYKSNDPRQLEMLELLNTINESGKDISLISLTPTSYPIEKSSVYAYL